MNMPSIPVIWPMLRNPATRDQHLNMLASMAGEARFHEYLVIHGLVFFAHQPTCDSAPTANQCREISMATAKVATFGDFTADAVVSVEAPKVPELDQVTMGQVWEEGWIDIQILLGKDGKTWKGRLILKSGREIGVRMWSQDPGSLATALVSQRGMDVLPM